MNRPRIVLASTSRYRAELLRRIIVDFEQISPATEEPGLPGETPRARAARLSAVKAQAVATRLRDALVIGSDQVAALQNTVLHKPGNIGKAHEQLHASGGNVVDFFTGLCLIDTRNGQHWNALDHTRVVFRKLSDAEIDRYIAQESPLDCAGSFKAEGLGIALFEHIESADPTALIGLPLIALSSMLREAGVQLP